jgi:hypothetical protein
VAIRPAACSSTGRSTSPRSPTTASCRRAGGGQPREVRQRTAPFRVPGDHARRRRRSEIPRQELGLVGSAVKDRHGGMGSEEIRSMQTFLLSGNGEEEHGPSRRCGS